MGEFTKIGWTTHTFNCWRGCAKVSAGCQFCYAERQAKRNPAVLGSWGPDARRAPAAENYWQQPLLWNLAAQRAGRRARVFCGSLMDVFEARPDLAAARARLWALIAQTRHLDWLLLTKRPQEIGRLLPDAWASSGLPANVWLGISAENQQWFDIRWRALQDVAVIWPATMLFVSAEPLLGPLDVSAALTPAGPALGALGWVIAGGESGPQARAARPEWFRGLRDQCAAAGVPFFFKSWGAHIPRGQVRADGMEARMYAAGCEVFGGTAPARFTWPDGTWAYRVGPAAVGDLLDGLPYHEFPTVDLEV